MSAALQFTKFANAVCGTWSLPKGLDLPDAKSNDEMLRFHQRQLEKGNSRAMALLRVGLMEAFKQVSRVSELKADIPENVKTGIYLYDEKDRELNHAKVNSFFFAGSGTDRIRNRDVGLRDLGLYNQTFDHQSAIYHYQTQTDHKTASRSWFNRLQDAYKLNIKHDFYSREAEEFVNEVFLPRISKSKMQKREHIFSKENVADPQKINVDTAAKNMRITLAGQSYGGTFSQMLINCLNDKMDELGYSKEETQKVFDNILIFSISGALPALQQDGHPSPKIISVEHEYDFVGFQMSRYGVHPRLNQDETLRADANNPNVLDISERRRFYWLNFDWQSESNPGGVPEPKDNSYSYHDTRAVLPSLPQQLRTTVKAALETRGNLADLQTMLTQSALPAEEKPRTPHL